MTGEWLTAAHAREGVPIPDLDRELVFEATALDEAADDFGHIVHRGPWAVCCGPVPSETRSAWSASSITTFAERKARFDPNCVLTPGQEIFPRRPR